MARRLETDANSGVGERSGGDVAPSLRSGMVGLETFDVSVRSTRTGDSVFDSVDSSSEDTVVGSSSSMMRLRRRLAKKAMVWDHRSPRAFGTDKWVAFFTVDFAALTARVRDEDNEVTGALAGVGNDDDEIPGTYRSTDWSRHAKPKRRTARYTRPTTIAEQPRSASGPKWETLEFRNEMRLGEI